MKKTVYYVGADGNLYSIADMQKAFYLSTGKKADDHYGDYIKFLSRSFGKSIVRYITPDVETLLLMGEKIKAVQLYHQNNGCSLFEAKHAVDAMQGRLFD